MSVRFRDYYEVLGVPRTASSDDIKKAYRRLARKNHPDLKPAAERENATQAFQQINEAHEVLSDPEKRRKYDALGENWKNGADFTPPPGAGGGFTSESTQWGGSSDFSDFFESIFGQAARSRGGARGGARGGVSFAFPGSDIEAELPITLEDLLRGGRRRITLDGNRNVDVEIPVGVRDGTVLRLAGQGGPGEGGAPAGDLFLRLRLTPDARFRVSGDDLEMDLPLWPWQAALGTSVRIETPEGPVSLKVPPETPSGQRLRLRERGVPRKGGSRGDLYAVVRIAMPEKLTPAEKEAYEALKRSSAAPADRPAQGST